MKDCPEGIIGTVANATEAKAKKRIDAEIINFCWKYFIAKITILARVFATIFSRAYCTEWIVCSKRWAMASNNG
jgi:hypothetical protein